MSHVGKEQTGQNGRHKGQNGMHRTGVGKRFPSHKVPRPRSQIGQCQTARQSNARHGDPSPRRVVLGGAGRGEQKNGRLAQQIGADVRRERVGRNGGCRFHHHLGIEPGEAEFFGKDQTENQTQSGGGEGVQIVLIFDTGKRTTENCNQTHGFHTGKARHETFVLRRWTDGMLGHHQVEQTTGPVLVQETALEPQGIGRIAIVINVSGRKELIFSRDVIHDSVDMVQNVGRGFNALGFNDKHLDSHVAQHIDNGGATFVTGFVFDNLIQQNFVFVGFDEGPQIGCHALLVATFGGRVAIVISWHFHLVFVVEFFDGGAHDDGDCRILLIVVVVVFAVFVVMKGMGRERSFQDLWRRLRVASNVSDL
mmetsp:Transcript_20663/g.44712  ORF Transcript_20663/g.44712 Transcript_20663/m.44712 type:complete len:366 (-) Transcript_20663:59-1156(-)